MKLVAYLDIIVNTAIRNKTEDNEAEMNLLIKETKELKSNITKSTKNEIITKLTKIWARAQKVGLEVIKEIFIDVSSEVIKKLLIP